jgi:tetratricopeptide (TPR) repeat protein
MKIKRMPNPLSSLVVRSAFMPQWLAAVLCITWSLVTFAADGDSYLREAQAYYDKGELSAAIIQLKNALLADPENGQARLLLGKSYLQQKDGLAAEKELSRAKVNDLAIGLINFGSSGKFVGISVMVINLAKLPLLLTPLTYIPVGKGAKTPRNKFMIFYINKL